MSTESKVVVVVAGGLGAVKPGAGWYYNRLCRLIGAELVTAHGAGFGQSSKTYQHFEADFNRLSEGGKQLVIIGHSLGAVHAVRYAAKHAHVVHLMLIGMPASGTAWCHLIRPFGNLIERFTPVLRDLVPNSAFLAEIAEELKLVADRTTCVEAKFDLIVLPSRSSHIEGAANHIKLPSFWVNHVNAVIHRDVLDCAEAIVAEANRIDTQASELVASP